MKSEEKGEGKANTGQQVRPQGAKTEDTIFHSVLFCTVSKSNMKMAKSDLKPFPGRLVSLSLFLVKLFILFIVSGVRGERDTTPSEKDL